MYPANALRPGASDESMIEFRHVAKTYPDGTTAVEDFTLTVPSHTATVLLGPSGCGKTTLLRMVNRMVDPTAGQVLIDGEDLAQTPPVALRRRIGYVMQNSGLLPHRKVIDNIATVPRLNGVSERANGDRIGDVPHAHGHHNKQAVGVTASDP